MKERRIREELTQCRTLLDDLFQGGLATVPETMPDRLAREAMRLSQYGMERLGGLIRELSRKLESRRHSFENEQDEEVTALFCKIYGHLEKGIFLAGMDEAEKRICQKDWEEEM